MKSKTKTALAGFFIGLFLLIFIFVVTVLIMASVNGRSFDQEILSWAGKSETVETVKATANALIYKLK